MDDETSRPYVIEQTMMAAMYREGPDVKDLSAAAVLPYMCNEENSPVNRLGGSARDIGECQSPVHCAIPLSTPWKRLQESLSKPYNTQQRSSEHLDMTVVKQQPHLVSTMRRLSSEHQSEHASKPGGNVEHHDEDSWRRYRVDQPLKINETEPFQRMSPTCSGWS